MGSCNSVGSWVLVLQLASDSWFLGKLARRYAVFHMFLQDFAGRGDLASEISFVARPTTSNNRIDREEMSRSRDAAMNQVQLRFCSLKRGCQNEFAPGVSGTH